MNKINFIKDLFARFNEHFNRSIGGGAVRKIICLLDIVFCFIIHGSSLTDYFEYEFYKKSNYEKKKFVTWRRAQKYFKILHDDAHVYKLHDKTEIYTYFGEFLGREWIYCKNCVFEKFVTFCQRHSVLIVKPPVLIEGNYRGIFDTQQMLDQVGKRTIYDKVLQRTR